jgi:5'-3' exonuclease
MKKIVFFCFVLLFVSCKSGKTTPTVSKEVKKPEFVKLNILEVNSFKKNRAYELGKRVLMTCNTSTFKPFTAEEATEEVLKKINKDKISMTCQNILRVFGQFNDIKLVEVLRLEENKTTVFRYKCDYEKKYKIKELQVSINDENKITAITTKDWKDAYIP